MLTIKQEEGILQRVGCSEVIPVLALKFLPHWDIIIYKIINFRRNISPVLSPETLSFTVPGMQSQLNRGNIFNCFILYRKWALG